VESPPLQRLFSIVDLRRSVGVELFRHEGQYGALLLDRLALQVETDQDRLEAVAMNQTPTTPAVVIDGESWSAGYKAGHQGAQSRPIPPGLDGLSWISGFIEGQADRAAGRVRPLVRRPSSRDRRSSG
jgi:hypothetical protein